MVADKDNVLFPRTEKVARFLQVFCYYCDFRDDLNRRCTNDRLKRLLLGWLVSFVPIVYLIAGALPIGDYLLKKLGYIDRPFFGETPFVFVLLVLLFQTLVMPTTCRHLMKRCYAREKVRLLSELKCPACLSDLRGQAIGEDGCVVCTNPKCCGTWRITDRVAQSFGVGESMVADNDNMLFPRTETVARFLQVFCYYYDFRDDLNRRCTNDRLERLTSIWLVSSVLIASLIMIVSMTGVLLTDVFLTDAYFLRNKSAYTPSALIDRPFFLETPFIFVLVLLVLLFQALIMPTISRYLMKRWFARKKVRLLSESKCPACLSDLRGQAIGEDGCVVCTNPECGGTWLITDRVAQP